MLSLPVDVYHYLERQLDWNHNGVDKDLSEIADHMLDWEELSIHLELTDIDIHDVKALYLSSPSLQR